MTGLCVCHVHTKVAQESFLDAAERGYSEVISVLLGRGISASSPAGERAFENAAVHGHQAVLQVVFAFSTTQFLLVSLIFFFLHFFDNFSVVSDLVSWGGPAAWEKLIGSFPDFEVRSVHMIFFLRTRFSDLRPWNLLISQPN